MRSALLFSAAALGGIAVSFINYLLLLPAVKGENDRRTMYLSPLRSLLAAAYLFLMYYLGGRFSVSQPVMLILGGLGLTAGLVFFTRRLVKSAKGTDGANGIPPSDAKGDDADVRKE